MSDKTPEDRADLIVESNISEKNEDHWYKLADEIDEANDPPGNFSEEDRLRAYFNFSRAGENLTQETGKDYFQKSLEFFKATVEIQKRKLTEQLPELSSVADKQYDVLITLVGFSPQPIMHTILTLKPAVVYLITSEQSKNLKNTNVSMKQFFEFLTEKYDEAYFNICEILQEPPVNEIGTADTFQKIRQLIEKIKKSNPEAKIAIDITGGKKSMDASAFLTAAIEKGIDIFYVDFEGYKDSKPVYGTEFLNKLDNPYDIYSIREEELVKEFWRTKDFAEVDKIVKKIVIKFGKDRAKAYGLEEKYERFQQIQKAAKCYDAWSNFNYALAQESTGFDFYGTHHQGILSELAGCSEKRWTEKGAIYLAADRWMRGNDFLDKDLDKAALCFTQVIELLSEYRFWEMYGDDKLQQNPIDESKPVKEIEFRKSYLPISNLLAFLFTKNNFSLNGLNLKVIWKDKTGRFGKNKRPEGIFDAIGTRNKIAHFNCFSQNMETENHNKVEHLKEVSKAYIELFIETYKDKMENKTFDDLIKRFEFASIESFYPSRNSN